MIVEPAFVGCVRRQYRSHTLIKAPKTVTGLQDMLHAVIKNSATRRVAIDVDAIGLF